MKMITVPQSLVPSSPPLFWLDEKRSFDPTSFYSKGCVFSSNLRVISEELPPQSLKGFHPEFICFESCAEPNAFVVCAEKYKQEMIEREEESKIYFDAQIAQNLFEEPDQGVLWWLYAKHGITSIVFFGTLCEFLTGEQFFVGFRLLGGEWVREYKMLSGFVSGNDYYLFLKN